MNKHSQTLFHRTLLIPKHFPPYTHHPTYVRVLSGFGFSHRLELANTSKRVWITKAPAFHCWSAWQCFETWVCSSSCLKRLIWDQRRRLREISNMQLRVNSFGTGMFLSLPFRRRGTNGMGPRVDAFAGGEPKPGRADRRLFGAVFTYLGLFLGVAKGRTSCFFGAFP